MIALFGIRSFRLLPISTRALSVPRNQLLFPETLLNCRAKSDGPSSSKVVPSNLLAAEREAAKAVLSSFLKKQGLSNVVAARTIKKADFFIDHLVSRLHCVHKSRYLVGREITTLEMRDSLIPYFETLIKEHGDILVNVVENFAKQHVKERSVDNIDNPPVKERSVASVSPSNTARDSKKLKALARVSKNGPSGKLPPHTGYLMEFGVDLDRIKQVTWKFPTIAFSRFERKIKHVVEFLVDLGVAKSDIPKIIYQRPQLCGFSLSKNLIPTMAILENLGLDKKQWAKVVCRCPSVLTHSVQKLKSTVDFLYEMGLSAETAGKVLKCFPSIIGNSVEDKLLPTAEYFHSMGVDVAKLLNRSPQVFGLSIESNVKPVTEFFLERGYNMRDIGSMTSKYGNFYTLSLAKNLTPKWEFFLTMEYPKIKLVRFPQYFGYSLEGRIKPRFAAQRENGVRMDLNSMLSRSNREFEKALKRKVEKMLVDKAHHGDSVPLLDN